MAPSIQRHHLLRKRLDRFTRLLHRLAEGDVVAVHRTRVASRRLRELLPIAIELSAEAAGQKRTPELQTLKGTQDLLGRLRDFQVLTARVRQMQVSLAPPDVGVWRELDAVITSLENSCRRLHARSMRERAGIEAICGRVSERPPSSAARRAAG